MIKRFGTVIVFVLLAVILGSMPILAQDEQNSVSFNGVSFDFPSVLGTNINIKHYQGDSPSLEQPGGPVPPHTEFILYNDTVAPNNFYEVPVSILVYHTADFADYPMYQAQFDALNNLLSNNSDLSTFEVATMGRIGEEMLYLPYLPVPNASQVIRANANYVITESYKGVSYISAYRQDVSPFTSNDFLYTLQGVSNDGSVYVVVNAYLPTTAFVAEIPADFNYDAFVADYENYMAQTAQTLNEPSVADTFTPSLTILDEMFLTISLN